MNYHGDVIKLYSCYDCHFLTVAVTYLRCSVYVYELALNEFNVALRVLLFICDKRAG